MHTVLSQAHHSFVGARPARVTQKTELATLLRRDRIVLASATEEGRAAHHGVIVEDGAIWRPRTFK